MLLKAGFHSPPSHAALVHIMCSFAANMRSVRHSHWGRCLHDWERYLLQGRFASRAVQCVARAGFIIWASFCQLRMVLREGQVAGKGD